MPLSRANIRYYPYPKGGKLVRASAQDAESYSRAAEYRHYARPLPKRLYTYFFEFDCEAIALANLPPGCTISKTFFPPASTRAFTEHFS